MISDRADVQFQLSDEFRQIPTIPTAFPFLDISAASATYENDIAAANEAAILAAVTFEGITTLLFRTELLGTFTATGATASY